MEISIGNELKDAFKPTERWVKAGLEWIGDLEAFYRQRAVIEAEYADKLKSLCSETFKKKAKVSAAVSVGPDPLITPGSLESASLVAWNEIISQTEQLAKERGDLAKQFDKRVVATFSDIQARYDAIRQRWKQADEDLQTVRNKHFEEVNKAKKEYDSACQAMENQRSKTEKSSGERTHHKYEKREFEMNVAKNNYLIKINIANRLKDKYYYQDLPEVLDGLQALNESRVNRVNGVWLTATALERQSLENGLKCLDSMERMVKQNLPKLDTVMFVKHNMGNWTEPADFYYVPSNIWHDDESMITTSGELEVLKQRLSESSRLYERYERICAEEKQQLAENAEERRRLMEDAFSEVKVKSKDEYYKYEILLSKGLAELHKFANDDTNRVTAEVEIETIQSAAEGKDLTLTRPVEKKKKRTLGFLRKKTANEPELDDVQSVTSGVSRLTTTTHGSTKGRLFGQIGSILSGGSSSGPSAKALYAYTAGDADEASIMPGDELQVLEEDTGSGWTRVQTPAGETGLVPTTYIQVSQSKKQGPKVAPRKGARRVKYMEILYDYEPQGDDELGVAVGDRVAVVTEDPGTGWTEGEIDGVKGLFPTSYGRLVE